MASPLQDKSKAFALEIIKVCNEVKRSKRESVLTNQLIRSGTSVGANIREAMYAHGKADFIAKLQIALKECSESEYWLELLIESGCSSLPLTLRKRIRNKGIYTVAMFQNSPEGQCPSGEFFVTGRWARTHSSGVSVKSDHDFRLASTG